MMTEKAFVAPELPDEAFKAFQEFLPSITREQANEIALNIAKKIVKASLPEGSSVDIDSILDMTKEEYNALVKKKLSEK